MLAHRSVPKHRAQNPLEFDGDEVRRDPLLGEDRPQGLVELGLSYRACFLTLGLGAVEVPSRKLSDTVVA